MTVLLLAIALTAVCPQAPMEGDAAAHRNLMPVPASVEFAQGKLTIDGSLRIELPDGAETRLHKAATRLLYRLTQQTGILFIPGYDGIEGAGTVLRIEVDAASALVPSLADDESYRLTVGASGATLSAATTTGALRGIETFLQLVEPGGEGFAIPFVNIEDRPRFRWRGLLLDSCRHWLPPEAVHRTLEAMASVKLNVLHWHLSEDQGFRVECKTFPRLHRLGSDGLYYTHEQIREVIEHAADLGIRVVPEFDMPGHATAWFVGHPELASAPGPYEISREWGVLLPVMDPTREEVYAFIDAFVGEMAALFPDEYFHIGGDEVEEDHWLQNPAIRKFMSANGLADCPALQAHFNRRLLAILQKHGKRMVGWDEIFHPDLPTDIVVQSWRGSESLAEGTRKGYQGILSNGYYIDLFYHAGDHYAVDPLAKASGLTAEEKARILGGEACMWGELLTPELLDSRTWPRAAAVAERLWSPATVTDVDDMYRRLEIQSARLEQMGLNVRCFTRTFLERLAGPGVPTAGLELLAEAVEPVKGYRRHRSKPYRSYTPLNRFVDAVPAESFAARAFVSDARRMVSSREERPAIEASVEAFLKRLAGNHAGIAPLLESREALREIIPLSMGISLQAQAGLKAVELIVSGEQPSEAMRALFEELLKEPEEGPAPEHEMQSAILPGIRVLVKEALNNR